MGLCTAIFLILTVGNKFIGSEAQALNEAKKAGSKAYIYPEKLEPPIKRHIGSIPREKFWLVKFPPGYEEFEKAQKLTERQSEVLDEYLADPENTDITKLGISRQSLLDLLCIHEFGRSTGVAHHLLKITSIRVLHGFQVFEHPLEIIYLRLSGCEINWIPVTEIAYLFRALKVIWLDGVTGNVNLKDLNHLLTLEGLILKNMAISEFPHFLCTLANLGGLVLENTDVTNIDFRNEFPFPALKSLTLYLKPEQKLGAVIGLKKGLPELEDVCVMGKTNQTRWEWLVGVYLPEREVKVIEGDVHFFGRGGNFRI